MKPEHKAKLDQMRADLDALYALDSSMAMQIVADAAAKAKRLRNRLTVPKDAERVEFVQDSGPIIEFTGRKLWSKEKGAYLTEFWSTLSGEWILLNSSPGGNRAFVFTGDERTPEMVMIATGYADWTKGLVKGMGWSKHLMVD